jgi:DNA-binding NarL/FixJ family response regulator
MYCIMTIRVLIADDHAIVRHGLCRLIALTSDIELAGEARDGWEVVEKVRAGGFDLLLTDMSMPGPNGPELVKRVRAENAALPILVLSMHGESQIAARAIKAGATGYLTKDSDPEMLLDAIRRCAAGGISSNPIWRHDWCSRAIAASSADLHARLSDREFQIFTAACAGARGQRDCRKDAYLAQDRQHPQVPPDAEDGIRIPERTGALRAQAWPDRVLTGSTASRASRVRRAGSPIPRGHAGRQSGPGG